MISNQHKWQQNIECPSNVNNVKQSTIKHIKMAYVKMMKICNKW